MKKRGILLIVCLSLLLAGCSGGGAAEQPPATSEAAPPVCAEPAPVQPVRTITELVMEVEGQQETVAAEIWDFGSYCVTIPAEDWTFTQYTNCECWGTTWNDRVYFSVYHFPGKTQVQAIHAYAEVSGFLFEDLLGGGSPEGYLTGNRNDLYCCYFAAENGDVIAWEFPAEAAEGFGARMTAMAKTYLPAENASE